MYFVAGVLAVTLMVSFSIVTLTVFQSVSDASTPASRKPHLESSVDISGGLPKGFEPSGAAWQPRLQRLMLVGDEGTIASMDVNGGSVLTWSLAGDLEGICVADPESNKIYVAVERPASIVEFDFSEGRALRRFPFPGIEGSGHKKNKGPEALTFVPDPNDPEGGAFWAGIQADGSVRVLSLPLRSNRARTLAREIRRFTPIPGLTDLSGLDWDRSTDTIWAVFDKNDLLVRLDRSGRVLETWGLPGKGQEGIAVTGDHLFIADDTARRVVRYRMLDH